MGCVELTAGGEVFNSEEAEMLALISSEGASFLEAEDFFDGCKTIEPEKGAAKEAAAVDPFAVEGDVLVPASAVAELNCIVFESELAIGDVAQSRETLFHGLVVLVPLCS